MLTTPIHCDSASGAAAICTVFEPFPEETAALADAGSKIPLPANRQRRVLGATFSSVRRYRDYCRVEAIVTVTFQYHPSLPARTERLLTSVPMAPNRHPGDLRERLIESAVDLCVLMHRSERGAQLRPI